MDLKTFTTLAILGVSTTARIVGISAPTIVAPSNAVSITLITENYIQSVTDVSVAFGLASSSYPDYLGSYLGSFYLGPENSNVLHNITFWVPTPSSITNSTSQFLNAVVTSLYGVGYSPVSVMYHLPVTIGDVTSNDLSSITGGSNICTTTLSSDQGNISQAISARSSDPPQGYCFQDAGFGDAQSLIRLTHDDIAALIRDLILQDNSTALVDFNATQTNFSKVYQTIMPPDEGCVSTQVEPFPSYLSPADALIRALQILQGASDALTPLERAIWTCNTADAAMITCSVLNLINKAGKYWTS